MEIRALASSSAGNCYVVSDGTTTLLLECGIRFREIQAGLRFKMKNLAGCILSHEHRDHSYAVADVMRAGVDVYASKGTAEALQLRGHRLRIVEPLQQVQIGTWTVLPFDAVHDSEEPLGFLLSSSAGKVLYLIDSAYCRYRFRGLTHVMIECNYSIPLLLANALADRIHAAHKRRVLRNHMGLERVLELLRANDLSSVREIHLLHLSDQNSDEAQFKAAVAAATGKPVYVSARQATNQGG